METKSLNIVWREVEYYIVSWKSLSLVEADIDFIECEISNWHISWEFRVADVYWDMEEYPCFWKINFAKDLWEALSIMKRDWKLSTYKDSEWTVYLVLWDFDEFINKKNTLDQKYKETDILLETFVEELEQSLNTQCSFIILDF